MQLLTTSSFRLLSAVLSALTAGTALAANGSTPFSDVPKSHFAHDAILSLSDHQILKGYKDGTFKPDRKVNRAEALQIIAASSLPETRHVNGTSDFSDVPDTAWYLPAVTWGLDRGVIDGPPTTKAFHPARPVTKAEFLKMLLAGNGIDRKSFGDITLPLSSDVTDTTAWFYPSLRYAVATATTVISDAGLYGPTRELTRGDVALILYRFTMYKNKVRTQDMLLEIKRDVEGIITDLSKGDVRQAEYSSAQAILLARGAVLIEPEEDVVKVAVKIAEGFRALTRAYRASLNGDRAAVLKLSADASTLAAQARKISPDAKTLADQLDQYSKSFSRQAGSK